MRDPQDLTSSAHREFSSSDSSFDTTGVRTVSEQGFTKVPQYSTFSYVSTSPLPSTFPSRTMFAAPSFVSLSRTGYPRGGAPTLEPPQQFGHYSLDNDGLLTSRTSPDGAYTGPLRSHAPQLFVPGESNGYGVWSEGDWAEIRNPHKLGSEYGTSPTGWTTKMKTVSLMNDTPLSNRIVNEGDSYYPPPPGQQQPAQTESDVMQMKLRLMKAQHELEVERVRLEQKAQIQLIKKQLQRRG